MTDTETTNETGIIHCPKCGLHTRHERQQREQSSLFSRLIGRGRTRRVEYWMCTKCGHSRRVG